MEIADKPRIGIVGGGSWATAIAKMLVQNNGHVNWFMRNIESIKAFKVLKHNPRYLCGVEFDVEKISFTDDLDKLVRDSDVIVFAVPSAFVKNVVSRLNVPLKNKVVVSAIKGLIPDDNLILGEFFHREYHVPLEQIVNVLKESMSAKIFELLKRGDESYVVMAAHKNARFVEDCVREMARQVVNTFTYLPGDTHITIRQTNEESIHQHDAYAERKATLAELREELNV